MNLSPSEYKVAWKADQQIKCYHRLRKRGLEKFSTLAYEAASFGFIALVLAYDFSGRKFHFDYHVSFLCLFMAVATFSIPDRIRLLFLKHQLSKNEGILHKRWPRANHAWKTI